MKKKCSLFYSVLKSIVLLVLIQSQTGCFLHSQIGNLDSVSLSTDTPIEKVHLLDPANLYFENLVTDQGKLKWTAPSNAVTQYRIVISSTATPAEHCTDSSAQVVNSPSIDISSLIPDTSYYYRVCSADGSDTSVGVAGTFKTLKLVTRVPSYSTSANWNDYVINNGAHSYDATGAVCAGTIYSINSCINGGLLHKIVIPTLISCSRVSASDALDVFQWSCDNTTSETIIYSTDVKPFKGLQDLILNNQFRDNHIVVKIDNQDTYATVAAKWWTNVIEDLPLSNVGSMTTINNGGQLSGKIFTVNTSRTSGGYIVADHKLSIVVMKGATLTKGAGDSNQFIRTDSTYRNYNWLEGQFDTHTVTAFSSAISLGPGVHVRAHNIRIFAGTSVTKTVSIGSVGMSVISDFEIYGGGVAFDGSAGGYNLIRNGKIIGMEDSAFSYMSLSTIKDVLIANSSSDSMIAYPQQSIFMNITMVNNQVNYGLRIFTGRDNLFHNILSINNAGSFVYSWSSISNTYSQIFTSGSTTQINISSTGGAHKFTNNLVLESGTVCLIVNNTAHSPGLVTGTCANHGLSDATTVFGVPDYAKFIVGKVSATDTINQSNILGLSSFSSITDWFKFENFFRSWGLDGDIFPASTHRGNCETGSCRIWDYRLKADSQNLAFNSTNLVTSKNQMFVVGSACPSAVAGNKATTYTDTTIPATYTFLTNASELSGDGVGNDNGLCESNEACLYTPNFGAYQGEGDFKSPGTCTFQDGTISGVKLYAYPTNGI